MLGKKLQLIYFKKAFLFTKVLILFLLFSSQVHSQNVAINEVMSSNDVTLADEDGEFNDWIEIYNYGTTAVNIGGYGLTDDASDPYQWVFPTYTLEPQEFLLIWASGKDKTIPSQPLHANFKISSGGETIILTNSGGTEINNVPAIAIATDVSYGRQPDGTGSWEFFNTPTPKLSNTGTVNAATEKIAINEVMSSNDATIADEDGDFNDWVELYNYGTTSVNLEGYGLSDDNGESFKWTFPSITIDPNQYILVWASDKDISVANEPLHANFKISSGGESIFLKNPSGALVSGSPSVVLDVDVSYGRQPDGTGDWLYFDEPTPLASNTSSGLTEIIKPPVFSHASGLFSEPFNLSLTAENEGAVIIYTLDGSEPDINNLNGSSFQYKNDYPYDIGESFGEMLNQSYQSFSYTGPIEIRDRSNDEDVLARKNTVSADIYIPPVKVRKATVLRAKAFLNGKGSRTRTRNYFIWPEGNPYDVPVISLTTFEENLFGYEKGIYTSGKTFDDWRTAEPNGNQPGNAQFSNYGQDGREWEREVHVQVFNENLESILNQDAGIRIHGNTSRADIIKNLRIYARSEYDEDNEFELDVFDQQIPDSPVPYNNTFKRLMLRGNGSGGQIANDMVFSRLMQPFFNGIMRIKTAVNFINGEYFGITAIRDRFDVNHIANNFGLDSDNVSIVSCVGSCVLQDGPDDRDSNPERVLRYLFKDLKHDDLKSDVEYQKVADILDIDSYIDHIALETFSEGDSYEIKFWRATNPVNDEFGDGKFRVYTQDFEAAMISRLNWLEDFSGNSSSWQRNIFSNLIDNEGFKVKFINRTADLLNTAFVKERFDAIVNETFDVVAPLLEEDRNRSPRLRFYEDGDKVKLLDWIQERPAIFRDQINELFEIDKTINLDLNVSNPNAGYITLNTININSTTPGVNDKPYPWSGVYFDNIPVTLEANPMPGYTFSHWSGDASGNSSKITITPTDDLQISAIFTPDEDYSHLLYFWLFDDNITNDTPLESLNSTYSRNDLTAMMNYNSSLSGYPFDANNADWRKASLERTNKPVAINYQTIANDNIAYAPEMMKGLQIKQPFKSGSLENNFELDFSTVGYEDIKISLAINSDGAANTIIAEYWNGSNWVSTNIINGTQSIVSDYELKEFDFSNVSLADENEAFKVRFRFNGTDMTEDADKKVIFNNVAISAVDKNVLSADEFIKEKQNIMVYPNPAKDKIKIFSNTTIKNVLVYNVLGKLVYKSEKLNNSTVDLSNFSKGIYFVKVFSDGSSTTKRIVKE
ncbi:Listeria/Bacterioides repeat-containing protein/Por secretion system C-terminal sorting domain-containing protein [Polaribacter sp. KT25b]|uniref:lamin tail domain-containing protein n=1 Tax=Polaribacter sp. KT25b TaxID=1855336 RepID=UPI00087DE455|nr:lamin tail domain-containing protein [Polaribacter sp. KT25b]SDR66787.1 Listeria/Bacterioides repeat-containing protein/Por secretion system C-terminal sorting domain-containing protein [Polaribacter sp. KT25b]